MTMMTAWEFSGAAEGAAGCCGDVAFDFALTGGRHAVAVVDVAGHGRTRARLSGALAFSVARHLVAFADPVAALLAADAVLRRDADDLPYAVGFVAVIDAAFGTIEYASAGFDTAFILSGDAERCPLTATGAMLGAPFMPNLRATMRSFVAGEALVIATDGAAESRAPSNLRFFGTSGVADAVRSALRVGDDPARAVYAAARRYAGGAQQDDIGVSVLRFARRVSADYRSEIIAPSALAGDVPGKSMLKIAPPPGALLTEMRPPWSATNRAVSASPSPLPAMPAAALPR